MSYKYCPMCATPLVLGQPDDRQRHMCPACGFIHYQNPVPAAGILLIENDELLLVKRKFPPAVGTWSLPAGFVEFNESPQETAVREAFEETGLQVTLERLFDVVGSCNSLADPITLVLYIAHKSGGQVQAGDDAEDARFFPIDALPTNIAFSTHRHAIHKYLQEFQA